MELLKLGAFVEFDNFGKEFTCEPGGFADGSFAKDSERVKLVKQILLSKYASQLLITNDICLKCMLRSRGGEGYAHIFRNIMPMIAAEGFDIKEITQILLHDNPLRMLCGK
jgi:phosphotriesterase-related protein